MQAGSVRSGWQLDTSFGASGVDESQQGPVSLVEWSGKRSAAAGESSGAQRHDSGHLAGITQSEFETLSQGRQGEKTIQERMEEDIVMKYVKKQSILENSHRSKGKGRTTALDSDDDDLQRALQLSLQDMERSGVYRNGVVSRI